MKAQTSFRKIAVSGLMGLAALTLVPVADGAEWSGRLAVAEACCCNPMCPCILNSPPTKGYCRATGLIEIRRGHYGEVRLEGVSLVVTVQHLSGFAASALPTPKGEIGNAGQHSVMADYVQYRSLQHRYHGKDLDFDYSKTHGATYTLNVNGRD